MRLRLGGFFSNSPDEDRWENFTFMSILDGSLHVVRAINLEWAVRLMMAFYHTASILVYRSSDFDD